MCKTHGVLFLTLSAFVAGCASRPSPVSTTVWLPDYSLSNTLRSKDFHLSLGNPKDSELKIRLISIANDSTTIIRLDSGDELSGKPGEYFSCSQFGRFGLELISASHKTGAAVFRCTWCESQ